MPRAFPLLLCLALGACATAPNRPSGQLSSYDALAPKPGGLRASVLQRPLAAAPGAIQRVAIAPPRLAAGRKTAWLSANEREGLLREVEAQLCFELTERYELVDEPSLADATVVSLVTRVKPTGRVGSTASAAAGFFIPGPIGLRLPGALGGLSAEAEMLDPAGRQIAAVVWSRNANTVGTDNPSLSRIGDALQFVEPFADAAAAAMSPKDAQARKIPAADPCAQYGSRFRPEGWLAKFATGLYVPQLSGARPGAETGEKREAVAR